MRTFFILCWLYLSVLACKNVKAKPITQKINCKPKTRILFHYEHFAINLLKSEVNNIFSRNSYLLLVWFDDISLLFVRLPFYIFFPSSFFVQGRVKSVLYLWVFAGGSHTWTSKFHTSTAVPSSKYQKNWKIASANDKAKI